MPEHDAQDHLLSNTAYDALKHTAQIGLPALGTLYFTLSQIWGLPAGEEVVGTIVAIDAFLGLLLGYSTKTYNDSEAKYDGQINVEEVEGGKKLFTMELNQGPDNLDKQEQVVFKVVPQPPDVGPEEH